MSQYPDLKSEELHDSKQQYPVLAHEDIWQGRIVSLHAEDVQLGADGPVVRREYVKHPGAVAVVPLRIQNGREQVLMIRQYRHPVAKNLWEFPAGLLDIEGENYLVAAQRELAEETDLAADTWNVLVDYYASPGGYTESLRVFLARDLKVIEKPEFAREEEEALFQWGWVDLDEAVKAVHEGRLQNPSAVLGILATTSARAQNWKNLRPADAPWER
ncbi:ADP-ribose diphosphatase [Boudabousia liubingyangii]|uniref:NUDIX domain-containing protein n=1 Tax=Boudabousia liubingyangii TaxID=1921764 RepID=UPI00093A0318|nr:NUDIX hydrolase [Boudabousia liubingyangii]OKL47579.1 ADP-ribose diphosphatase [Boudabousia liubingyangii]